MARADPDAGPRLGAARPPARPRSNHGRRAGGCILATTLTLTLTFGACSGCALKREPITYVEPTFAFTESPQRDGSAVTPAPAAPLSRSAAVEIAP